MLVNQQKGNNASRVKFISYTGDYPNLCSGVLTLEVDGVQYKFGHNYDNCHLNDKSQWVFTDEDSNKPNFEKFWSSGGCVTRDEDWNFDVLQDEWIIDAEDLPEQFRSLAAEIDHVFNQNVPYGCCGGCV